MPWVPSKIYRWTSSYSQDTHLFSYFLVFQKLNGDQAYLQIAVYLLANVVGLGLGLYKVNAMGLLPTSQSDWLEFMVARKVRGVVWW